METLFFVAVVASQGQPDATKAVANAYIKQNKIDEALDNYQRTLINEQQRQAIVRTANVARVAIERQVTFKWTFP